MLGEPHYLPRLGLKALSRWRQGATPTRQLAIGQIRSHWSDRLPMIIRPSFWGALYPGTAARIQRWREGVQSGRKKEKKKGWNPATFFIWMAILIGSQSINMIVLKNEWQVFSRKADAKIALLREVIEKVHRGEDVDVERALGTGDAVQEREWKEVLEEVEKDDHLWKSKARRKARVAARKAERKAQAKEKNEAEEKSQAKGEESGN